MSEEKDENNNGSVQSKSPHVESLVFDARCGNAYHFVRIPKINSTLERIEQNYLKYIDGIAVHSITDNCERYVMSKYLDDSKSITDSWTGHKLAIFTSGQDVPGMNAAVRAAVRTAIHLGCKVFYIREGFKGMIEGERNIEEATWKSTEGIIDRSGAILGCRKSPGFKTRTERLKAALNLAIRGIDNLICIGDLDSLADMNMLRDEWPSLMLELTARGDHIPPCSSRPHLNITGIATSTANDICGTSRTLGFNSALHRVICAIDDISCSIVSYKRIFIIELPASVCGILPLFAGLSCEASVVFIREDPPRGDWRKYLCQVMVEKLSIEESRQTHMVLVADGAQDENGEPIKSTDIKQVLVKNLNMDDVRVVVFGDLLRAGKTVFLDRLEACRLGAEAVLTLMHGATYAPAYLVSCEEYNIVKVPLKKAIDKTRRAVRELEQGNFDDNITIRGTSLLYGLMMHHIQRTALCQTLTVTKPKVPRIALVCVGRPACGINAAIRAFVCVTLRKGYQPVFIEDGWAGLYQQQLREVCWADVTNWSNTRGCNIDTCLKTSKQFNMSQIAHQLQLHNLSGMVLLGGFEAFETACEILDYRDQFSSLCMPVTVIPASVANNVPGCAQSLGSDSALNRICMAIDQIKQAGTGTTLVEVGDKHCGYLATMAALTTGADQVFLPEVPFSLSDVQNTCKSLASKFSNMVGRQAMVIVNESANSNITLDVMRRIFQEEVGGEVTQSKVEIEQVDTLLPSARDRYLGTRVGCLAATWMLEAIERNKTNDVYTDSPSTVTLISTVESSPIIIQDIRHDVDYVRQVPLNPWWLPLYQLFKVLSNFNAKQ